MKPLPAQVQSHHVSGGSSSAPASPAALLKEQNRQREAAMAAQAIKRQKLTGGVGIATNSSGLVRHSSLTPGTPRAGTPSGGRAGSAGPRASQKGLPSKKVAPQGSKQSGVPRKSSPANPTSVGSSVQATRILQMTATLVMANLELGRRRMRQPPHPRTTRMGTTI